MFFDVLILVGATVLTPMVVVVVLQALHIIYLKITGASAVQIPNNPENNHTQSNFTFISSSLGVVCWIIVPLIASFIGVRGHHYPVKWYMGCLLVSWSILVLTPFVISKDARRSYLTNPILFLIIGLLSTIGLICLLKP